MHYHVPRACCIPIHGQRKLPHIFPAYFTKITFNIIKLSIHRLSQRVLSMRVVQPETGKNISFSCLPHAQPSLNFITLMKWLGEYISWHFTCSFFLICFLRRSRYFLTSKMIHICTNNSVCSWWFLLPFTHKIVLLCWFCTKDASPDKLPH